MQVDSTLWPEIGEFTYRYLRLERYLIDHGHFRTPNGPFPYASFGKYVENHLRHQLPWSAVKDRFPEMTKPISKREFKDGSFEWEEFGKESRSVQDLLNKLDALRDNLFHGSKAISGKEKDRDVALIREGISFLKLLAQYDNDYSKYL